MTNLRTTWVASVAVAVLMVAGIGSALGGGAFDRDDSSLAAPRRVCAYSHHRIDGLDAFGATIGRAFDCALVFNTAAPDWASWERPWFVIHDDRNLNWARWVRATDRRSLVVTQALIPADAPADWRQRGATGEYDDHARALARTLVRAGLGRSVIRLGPEANGTWTKDSIGDTPTEFAAWRTYWRRFARVLRSVPGAQFQLDWTVNAGVRPIPFATYYPGDDVVDIIGIDTYDFAVDGAAPSDPDQRWLLQYRRTVGMRDLVDFATAHHKPLSIPEWGLSAPGHAGGIGDNPRFIDGIARIVRTHDVAYQSYFLWTTDVGMLLTDAPNSLAAYRRHFGADGDSVG